MTRTYLSPEQQLRSQQVHKAHMNIKQLEEATAEAVKYHEKYLTAVEKVMTCLLDSSDIWEDVRTHLGSDHATMNPITPSSARLAASYNTWKVSKELRVLRDQLEGLQDVCKTARKQTKQAKTHTEELEKAAKKCAELNSPEYTRKIATRSDKAQQKLMSEKQKQNGRTEALDRTVVNDMKSTGTWWAARLVSSCDEIFVSFVNLGHRTLAAFGSEGPAAAPPRSRSFEPQHCEGSRPPVGGPVSTVGIATGVPLQFDSRPNAIHAL